MWRRFDWRSGLLVVTLVFVLAPAVSTAPAVDPAALMPREEAIYLEVDLGADNARVPFLRGLVEGILDAAMEGMSEDDAEFAAHLANRVREQIDWVTAGFGPKAGVLITGAGLERIRDAQRAPFGQARERAKATACANNLKQLAMAATIYAVDHDGVLPRAETWVQDLEPYVKAAQVFRCPNAPDLPVGYAMNHALSGRRLADIQRPSHTVLFFESDLGGANPAGGVADIAPPRHQGGNNFGFLDGHTVLSLPPADFPIDFGRWEPPPPPPGADAGEEEAVEAPEVGFMPDFLAVIDTRYGPDQVFEKVGLPIEPGETYRDVPLYLLKYDLADALTTAASFGFGDILPLDLRQNTALALTEGRLLVGSLDNVKAAIDLAAGEGEALADHAAFKRAVALLPEPRMVTFYEPIDLLRLAMEGVASQPEEMGLPEEFRKALERILALYEPFEAVAAGIDFSAEGLLVNEVTTVKPGAESELLDRVADVPAATEKGAALLPSDSLLYFTFGGSRDWLRLGLDVAKSISPELDAAISEGKKTIKQATGLDLDSMVFPLLGRDLSIAVTGVGGMPVPVQGVLMIQGPDAAIVKRKVNALRELLATKHKMKFLDGEASGVKYSAMMIKGTPLAIAYAQVDDMLIIASSADALEACLQAHADPTQALKAAEAYRAHRNALPDEMVSLAYLDLATVAARGVPMLKAMGADIPELDVPWDALGTIISGDYRQDDIWRSTMRWDLKPDIIVALASKVAVLTIKQARAQAKRTACFHNLKQLAAAALAYANDHDGVLPHADHWVQELEAYYKNAEILRCPNAPDLPIAYAMNRALSGRRCADIENPAETPLFFESGLRGPSPAGGVHNIALPRHDGGNFFAFVDGHVGMAHPPMEFPDFGKWEAPPPPPPGDEEPMILE